MKTDFATQLFQSYTNQIYNACKEINFQFIRYKIIVTIDNWKFHDDISDNENV